MFHKKQRRLWLVARSNVLIDLSDNRKITQIHYKLVEKSEIRRKIVKNRKLLKFNRQTVPSSGVNK